MPMNETAWIFISLVAYGVGHATAWFFKDMGKLVDRWGGLIVYFAFPTIFMMILLGGALIADLNNVVISIIFAFGFLVRMLKRNG